MILLNRSLGREVCSDWYSLTEVQLYESLDVVFSACYVKNSS